MNSIKINLGGTENEVLNCIYNIFGGIQVKTSSFSVLNILIILSTVVPK
jgi:hypothetical protein